jgi:voltage-dependent calcium channel
LGKLLPATMASNNNQDRAPDDNSSTQRAIPLQNLSRDESDDFDNPSEHRGRRRSSGAKAGHGPRRSLLTGGGFKTYERVAEDSPSPTDRVGLRVTQPSSARIKENNPYALDDHDFVDDPGGFGFGFRSSSSRRSEHEEFMMSSFPGPSGNDFFPSTMAMDDDTTRLTDKKYLQPISGTTAADEQEGRTSMQSIRLGNSISSSRLGDDLASLENGLGGRRGSNSAGGSPSRSRSLSPSVSGSALHRAGTVMQLMSQRVVNLSNEPVEQAILRRESLRNRPPSSPSMHSYDGEPQRTQNVEEKNVPRGPWKTQVNPFKGKSLGIFSPDNPLRTRLCDILVHPFTEPFILMVIVVHAVLLAVQSAHSVYTHPRSESWGSQPIDYALFAIFVIYTIELSVRIIVSGLIWNAPEYSTLDRSLGYKQALSERGRNLFSLQREPSTKKKSTKFEDSQVTHLRKTFTGLQPPSGSSDDPRHGSRKRLAYRAFLRHSFNRLDFLAVISYWISFALQITGYSSEHNIYIFQMLSCLRLLRLLGITDGTSVSPMVYPGFCYPFSI